MGNATTTPRAKRRRFSLAPKQSMHDENTLATESLAKAETRAVQFLRASLVVILLAAAAAVSTSVYMVMRQAERNDFSNNFRHNALQLSSAFHEGLERNLGAVGTLSASITSHSLSSNQSFPFTTLPDFEVMGSNVRVQSGSSVVVYAPLVTDDQLEDWEAYALRERGHVDESYAKDNYYRVVQDARLEAASAARNQTRRLEGGLTVLDDGTNYHPKIWNMEDGVSRDVPAGTGPYLPIWQRR